MNLNKGHNFSLIFLAILLLGFLALKLSGENTAVKANAFQTDRLKTAVFWTVTRVSIMPMDKYENWPLHLVAQDICDKLNRERTELTDEERELSKSLPKALRDGIPFAAGSPTKSWQIVIVGDSENGLIRLDGYGTDLAKPLISQGIAYEP